MNKAFINQSKTPMPKKYLSEWVDTVEKQLRQQKIKLPNNDCQLVIVFLDQAAARALNKKFRRKDYPTDVLSFNGQGNSLGELVLCPQVVKKQAIEHGLNFRQECAYLVLHGILHLLGYEHESDKRRAQQMYSIQDKIFTHIW